MARCCVGVRWQVGPDDSLKKVGELLLRRGLAMLPVLHFGDPSDPSPPQLLHLATLAGILKCQCPLSLHSHLRKRQCLSAAPSFIWRCSAAGSETRLLSALPVMAAGSATLLAYNQSHDWQ